MRNKFYLVIIILSILNMGCEDALEDTTPPSVTITTPLVGTVYEIVTISCMASDDSGVDKLELWIDGMNTFVSDSTEPYQLNWNTTVYEDGSAHSIVVRAYDINGNIADSPSYPVVVDNSVAYPSAVILEPVVYDDVSESFVVTWSASTDDDFVSYTLLEGISDDINSMDAIHTTNIVDNTSFTVSGISEGTNRYYAVRVHDLFDYKTDSNIEEGISPLIPPLAVILEPVVYDDISESFVVTWSASIDKDFLSYTLLEGISDESDSMDVIFTTNSVDDTTFTVSGIFGEINRYYLVRVHDTVNNQTDSNVEQGYSPPDLLFWNNVYGHTNQSDWGNSIIEVDDGYWIAGVSNQAMRLLKIDLLGNIVSDQFISGGYANEIIDDEDGSLYVVGGAGSWNNSYMNIIKLDYNGNAQAQSSLQIESSEYGAAWAYGAIMGDSPTSNEYIYVYGEMDGMAVVYSVDQDLNNFELVYLNDEMIRVKDMTKLDNGYLITSSNNEHTNVVKTNLSFEGQYEITVDGYSRSISSTEDGNVLLVMQTGDMEHTMMKFNISTSIVNWQISADGIYNGFEVDGSYYALGHHNGASLFMKLDINGNIISSSTFGSGVISDYSLTSDGGLVLTGTTNYWNDQLSDTPVFKTDLEGTNPTGNGRFNNGIVEGNSIIIPNLNNLDLNHRPF